MTIYLWILAVWFAAQTLTSMLVIAGRDDRDKRARAVRLAILIAEVLLGYTALMLLRG